MLIPFGVLSAAGADKVSLSDYELIATVFGTGSASSVLFSTIPQTYKHLQLRAVTRTAFASQTDTVFAFNFNNNGASTSSAVHFLIGTGSGINATVSLGNYSAILGATAGNSATANAYGATILDILDYTSTTKNKTLRSIYGLHGSSTPEVGLISSLPTATLGTNAITSMQILFNGNITSASRFSLYGIRG
jgi:hypothetical protein